jgi:DNA-directed RNA polymerase specialized sigma24 family protein
MGDQAKPSRGDEARLFEQFNDELIQSIGRSVHTTPEVIEDACGVAWAQFLAHQPDRTRNWKGWLFRTAQHEAWRLDRQQRETNGLVPAVAELGAVREPADPKDPHGDRLGLITSMEVLEQLPPRLRRIAFMRAAGFRYREIGAITGDSEVRVNQLVARANFRIYEVLGRMRERDQDLPPRVKRLRDLESAPPRWLKSEIGPAPRNQNHQVAFASRQLAWRRAALAIDDYRATSGSLVRDRGLGQPPSDPDARRAYDRARRAIDGFNATLTRSREIG